MTAYQYRMPAGIPGDVNRVWAATIEPENLTPSGTTGAPLAFGVPMVVDQTTGNVGNMRTMGASDSTFIQGLAPYGILVREYPTGRSEDPLGTSTPPASGPCSILKRGYMTVLLSGTAAAYKGCPAWIWYAASSGSHIQGGWEAANTGGSTMALTNAYFTGPADANGNVEIAYNI